MDHMEQSSEAGDDNMDDWYEIDEEMCEDSTGAPASPVSVGALSHPSGPAVSEADYVCRTVPSPSSLSPAVSSLSLASTTEEWELASPPTDFSMRMMDRLVVNWSR